MIDSNNQLKTLSKSLLNAVLNVMEATKDAGTPMSAKQKELAAKAPPYDKITHADVLVGRGVLKKHPIHGKLVVAKEEADQIDELSPSTMGSYAKKASADFTARKPKMGYDGQLKKMQNRRVGVNRALDKMYGEEAEQIDELSTDTMNNYARERSRTAFSGGRKPGQSVDDGIKMKSKQINSMALSKTKINRVRDTGSTILNKEEVDQIDELSIGTMKSYGDKRARTAFSGGRKPGQSVDAGIAQKSRQSNSLSLARTKINRARDTGSTILNKEEVENIDEALDAAARYGQHHVAIKELMKSISQHVESHKGDALKHRDYRGKKGVNWGHVGDVAQIHSQLADIHDRLAQQGEYKKSLGESVQDLDEVRGRPRKNPLPIGDVEPEPRQHIMQQLQRAKLSMRGGEDVTFKNGKKGHVSGTHASKILSRYAGMRPAEKEDFQKKISASHEAFKEHL